MSVPPAVPIVAEAACAGSATGCAATGAAGFAGAFRAGQAVSRSGDAKIVLSVSRTIRRSPTRAIDSINVVSAPGRARSAPAG